MTRMSETNTDLADWYMAYLRKLALVSSDVGLTPIGLIKADQEFLKQHIERELQNNNAAEVNRVWIDQPRSSPMLLKKTLLVTTVVLCLLGIAVLFTDWELKIALCQVILFHCGLLSLIALSVMNKEGESLISGLRKLLEQNRISVGQGQSADKAESVEQAIGQLVEVIIAMRQKELLTFDYCPYLVCQLDKEHKILKLNKSAERFWGHKNADLLDKRMEEVLVADCQDAMLDLLERCKQLPEVQAMEIRVKCSDGRLLDLLWRAEWSTRGQSYFCLAEDITARKDVERLKSETRDMINHDLRAPLSAMTFWANNMLSGRYGEISERSHESLNKVSRNLRTATELLDDLLDAEKMESATMPSSKSRLRLQDCFNSVSEMFSDWLKESQLNLEVEDSELMVNADVDQLTRILNNFMSNAIKWSPSGGQIKLRARQDGIFAIIEVEDSGPGIPPELNDTLFQRWVSGATSKKKGAPSSGLGLFIAKKFAELQGGAVGAKPANNGGSIFWVSLPLAS